MGELADAVENAFAERWLDAFVRIEDHPAARDDYLVGERDAAGRVRPGIEVLRGNPDLVAAVADSLDFEHKYRSLVITCAPDDRSTGPQIGTVLDTSTSVRHYFSKYAYNGASAGDGGLGSRLRTPQGFLALR